MLAPFEIAPPDLSGFEVEDADGSYAETLKTHPEQTSHVEFKEFGMALNKLPESVKADLHREGATICMVTHDPRYARFADRGIHLFDGRVVEE